MASASEQVRIDPALAKKLREQHEKTNKKLEKALGEKAELSFREFSKALAHAPPINIIITVPKKKRKKKRLEIEVL